MVYEGTRLVVYTVPPLPDAQPDRIVNAQHRLTGRILSAVGDVVDERLTELIIEDCDPYDLEDRDFPHVAVLLSNDMCSMYHWTHELLDRLRQHLEEHGFRAIPYADLSRA